MEVFKLEKPDSSLKIDKIVRLLEQGEDVYTFIEKANRPVYLFWDKVRHKPRPKGVTAEEFWALIKFLRQHSPSRSRTVVRDNKGTHFTWQPLPGMDHFFHEVDMQLGGALAASIIDDQSQRNRFITRGIMEEAIASSQLEGANTTRKVAKRMLLEKRKPGNRAEKMILNNYTAMVLVEEELRDRELSIEMLLDLHVLLTQGTIDRDEVGRFRRNSDEIVVGDKSSGIIYHVPPGVKHLKHGINELVDYANDEREKGTFVHPMIKAIILHFWVGYLHPFTDGNGRLARTIFYWYLLRNNYWAFSYLPVSRVIKNSPVQYREAYVYSEQDDNDLTYFIDYNIRKITQAKREFENYVRRKEIENRKMTEIARVKHGLNDRQIQLLRYLHKNSIATTSIRTHSQVNSISRVTARKDLEQLETLGFLTSRRVGRERPFRSSTKTSELF